MRNLAVCMYLQAHHQIQLDWYGEPDELAPAGPWAERYEVVRSRALQGASPVHRPCYEWVSARYTG
jgi:hypothetical protein